MSTKTYRLWQETTKVDNLTVSDITAKLGISRSYLYKLIQKHHISVPRNKTGRYVWSKEIFKSLSLILNINNNEKNDNTSLLIKELGLKQSYINNRRYLGNKYSLSAFIRKTVDENCSGINIVADVFSGTGAVSNIFKDKMVITNDLLYSNFLSNYAWFSPEAYSRKKIIQAIYDYNRVSTDENNYMRKNFSDTFFRASDCSKIGYIREDIEVRFKNGKINFKEYAILITSLLYAMDKIANTVGHYDAYRKNSSFEKQLKLDVLLPEKELNENNRCFNTDATMLVKNLKCDLLYLDPPYNSRQYCDAYHLLENVAKWEKPEVFGVARKMDRSALKSEYCTHTATEAFERLIENSQSKYILLSYNNMSSRGNDRSNAKISDRDIYRILGKKGKVQVFEENYKSFSTGKSNITGNKERLFLCETFDSGKKRAYIPSPFNYMGGKLKLLDQMQNYFYKTDVFLDLFSGGGSVGINSDASKIIFNDKNRQIIELIRFIRNTKTDELLERIDHIIDSYGLSNTLLYGYEYYGCNSNKGLSQYNKAGFLRLREDYNQQIASGDGSYILLYVLIVFSFNNQIRFNKKGEFNLPVGKRDFNSKMRSKLILFSESLKDRDVRFLNKDFRDIPINKLSANTFIYCDPPYLITNATYNENGMWTYSDEKDLLSFLDKVNKRGLKFALSNVLESKNKTNLILREWIYTKGYRCIYLNKNYSNSNYHRKNRESSSVEVLVTNYRGLSQ